MKKIKYFLFVLPLVVLLAGCDEHGDPQGEVEISEKQKAAIIMRGKWADDTFTLISLKDISPITSINVSQDGSVIRLTFEYDPGPGRTSGAGGYGVSHRKIAP